MIGIVELTVTKSLLVFIGLIYKKRYKIFNKTINRTRYNKLQNRMISEMTDKYEETLGNMICNTKIC